MDILSMPKIKQDEYLRRNLLHCKAVGIKASAEMVLGRLSKTKRPPRWIIKAMNDIIERAEPVGRELAYHRGEITRPSLPPTPFPQSQPDASQEETEG